MSEPTHSEVAILNAALELPQAERAAYLDRSCAGDAGLRQRVEALLQAHTQAEGFLESPPARLDFKRTMLLKVLPTEKPGDKIGNYKLLQQIGEGGCGVVYMAEQEEPVRRRVALKVIKLGMDTKEVIARFEAERQALALMDHPNIAKVFDAGATGTGRPYFVMELVRGVKITDFCDENKISTEERLKLFIQVCQAIQHAHQKGIIHRDIKPSNILVTVNDGVPVPKVIDFGIAKATAGRLTDKTLFTAFDQFIGTPAYMSPEQAVMTSLDIDTRSDIYSLGVLLYELLTGKTPFDTNELLQAGFDAMRRTIREIEPPKPSTRLSTMLDAERTATANHRQTDPPKLIHLVRGDLDWIVMKSLEKDRARRYETANGLAADIQRHLKNEPVNACPPSGLYRLQKAVRRNKGVFTASAAIVVVLLIGVIASSSEAIRAKRAEREQIRLRQKAETNEKKSEQVAQFLKDMLKGVGPSVALGRDTTMLREILDKTLKRVDSDLKDQPEVQLDMRFTLARVYEDLQLYKKMEETARETLRLARERFGDENHYTADALCQLGWALIYAREINEAESVARQAIVLQEKLHGSDSLEKANALGIMSAVLRHRASLSLDPTDKLAEAEKTARTALAIKRKRLGNNSDEVAWALIELKLSLHGERKDVEAEAAAREALAIHLKLFGEGHTYVASDYQQLGVVLGSLDGREAEAEDYLLKALAIQLKSASDGGIDEKNTRIELGALYEKEGKLAEAENQYRQAVAIERTRAGMDYLDLPGEIARVVVVLRKEGKLAEARSLAEEAVALCERLPGRIDHWIVESSFDSLKDVLTKLGDTVALKDLEVRRTQLEEKAKALADTPSPEAH